MHVGQGLGDRPIWITEMGWLGGWNGITDTHNSVIAHYMRPLGWWFAGSAEWPYPDIPTNPGYDAVAWYVTVHNPPQWPWTCLLDSVGPSSPPTVLGVYWNAWPNLPPPVSLPLVLKGYTGARGAGPTSPQPTAIPGAYPAPL